MNNEQKKEFQYIPGVDTKKGIVMTGGTEERYSTVLSMFCKDAEARLPLLQAVPEAKAPVEPALLSFVTQFHALKGTSGSIGAADISAIAAELEIAGKAGDLTLIQEKLPAFAEQLTELIKNIKHALEKWKENQSSPQSSPSTDYLPLLRELKTALESNKSNEINRILKALKETSRRQSLDSKTKEALEQISDEVMMVEYDNAKKIVEELMEAKHGK
jgi:HPt (histidine-containing phosphotransfer) domain-containing protein